jgi:hypothetical protein
VIFEGKFDLTFLYVRKPVHMYNVLQNILAKFRANLRNSENRDTGKEALKEIKSFRLKLLRKIGHTAVQSAQAASFLEDQ